MPLRNETSFAFRSAEHMMTELGYGRVFNSEAELMEAQHDGMFMSTITEEDQAPGAPVINKAAVPAPNAASVDPASITQALSRSNSHHQPAFTIPPSPTLSLPPAAFHLPTRRSKRGTYMSPLEINSILYDPPSSVELDAAVSRYVFSCMWGRCTDVIQREGLSKIHGYAFKDNIDRHVLAHLATAPSGFGLSGIGNNMEHMCGWNGCYKLFLSRDALKRHVWYAHVFCRRKKCHSKVSPEDMGRHQHEKCNGRRRARG
ncbi:hypothetical protein DXG03_004656 [Asterophora parasitica]|uniref:C2H2-type domain-containing protein n=1 Tax=Asterophora parasitica TaxID=117018 RepID=A0A9P7G0E7_9AGAR|nr:hypothetical protein DXG03_004656 [Asterophora parasitica]